MKFSLEKGITTLLALISIILLLTSTLVSAQNESTIGGPDDAIDCINRSATEQQMVFLEGLVWLDAPNFGLANGQQNIPPEPPMFAVEVYLQCQCGPVQAPDDALVYTNLSGQYQIPYNGPPNQTDVCQITFNPGPGYTPTLQDQPPDATDSDITDNFNLVFQFNTSGGNPNIDAGFVGPPQPPTAVALQATSTHTSSPTLHTVTIIGIIITILLPITLTNFRKVSQ